MTIDTQEFHELMMDYRGASPLRAQEAYEKVIEMVEGYCERHWLDTPQEALNGKSAREGYAANPAYISMSQAGLGADAHGYVRGWNDCVDAVINKENK